MSVDVTYSNVSIPIDIDYAKEEIEHLKRSKHSYTVEALIGSIGYGVGIAATYLHFPIPAVIGFLSGAITVISACQKYRYNRIAASVIKIFSQEINAPKKKEEL